jgi:hypothetical protein
MTRDVKEAVLEAAVLAGKDGGLVAYLLSQANQINPSPFMTMLSKLIPSESKAELTGDLNVTIVRGTKPE